MKIVKRDGHIVDYCPEKIELAIKKANEEVAEEDRVSDIQIRNIIKYVEGLKKKRMLVEDIQDIIEYRLMALGKYALAKEYLTYRYLRKFEKAGAKFLFNVYIPKENEETTEIDVLMISCKGLFVFESKNYGGWIFGSDNQKYWYQTFPAGHSSSLLYL